ncbi:MAG TPA: hypothetical protein VN796_07655, partial [Acidimicrobiales bacterium]|nr:hypothetical protein [Acidimicrobiales bacterium]
MVDQQRLAPGSPTGGAFGPNAWLVDDMYEEYRSDPMSVSESWREFFADYTPPGSPPPDSARASSNGVPAAVDGAAGSNGGPATASATATAVVPEPSVGAAPATA